MLEKVFNHGRKCFWEGKLENPYSPNTNKYREWERGFNSAYFQNLTKINQRVAG